MLNNLNWTDTFEAEKTEKTSFAGRALKIARFFTDTFDAALISSVQSPDMGDLWNSERTTRIELKKIRAMMD